jgi:ERF superfamily
MMGATEAAEKAGSFTGPPSAKITAAVKPTLHSKLADVVAELGYVAKDGKNEFQNYRYTSAEAILSAVRGPLSAKGITLTPSLTAISDREYTTSKGKASIVTTVHVTFTFTDGATGEESRSEWAGQGDDPADKALGKAYTNAVKTFVRLAFLIPQGDDPEADNITDARAADREPAKKENAPPPAPPLEPPAPPVLVSKEDIKELQAASHRVPVKEIRLTLGKLGLPAPELPKDLFVGVPLERAAELAVALTKVRDALAAA